MKTKLFNFWLLLMFLSTVTFAQEENPLDYFPHKLGNLWEYYTVKDYKYYYTYYTIIKDSIDTKGNLYIFCEGTTPPGYGFAKEPKYMIDKNYYVYFNPQLKTGKMYKLDAKVDEVWKVYDTLKAKVKRITENESWGKKTIIKEIEYYKYNPKSGADTSFTYVNYLYTHFIAKGFGCLEGEKFMERFFLRGCRIDGTNYGYVSVEKTEKIPDKLELKQNYPNPFNPSTTIEFELNEGENVLLEVFDMTGKRVAVLLNEYKPAGVYKFNFNINDYNTGAASGVYFYRLKTKNHSFVKKMVLIK